MVEGLGTHRNSDRCVRTYSIKGLMQSKYHAQTHTHTHMVIYTNTHSRTLYIHPDTQTCTHTYTRTQRERERTVHTFLVVAEG